MSVDIVGRSLLSNAFSGEWETLLFSFGNLSEQFFRNTILYLSARSQRKQIHNRAGRFPGGGTGTSDKTIVNRLPPGNFHVEFLPRAFWGASGADDHAPFMVTERILLQPLVLPQLLFSTLSREVSNAALNLPEVTSRPLDISDCTHGISLAFPDERFSSRD